VSYWSGTRSFNLSGKAIQLDNNKIIFDFDDEDRDNPIGSILRYHREQRKLDLANVSEELKVKLDYLQAMEQGRFDLLPSGFYRRSFLKAYAQYLKLDVDEMLKVLDEQEVGSKKGEAKPLTVPQIPIMETPPAETIQRQAPAQGLCPPVRSPARGTPAGFVFSVFLGLIIGAACLIFLFKGGEGEYDEAAAGLSMVEAESLQVHAEPPDTMELFMRLLDDKIGTAPELILRIEASGRSWIRITSDEVELYAGFINENMGVEFKAKESLSINLGVNEGIRTFLNGFEMRPLEKGVTYLDRENYYEFIPSDKANEIVRAHE
jgi:transcriptional regulator with XRE-family HTH domain